MTMPGWASCVGAGTVFAGHRAESRNGHAQQVGLLKHAYVTPSLRDLLEFPPDAAAVTCRVSGANGSFCLCAPGSSGSAQLFMIASFTHTDLAEAGMSACGLQRPGCPGTQKEQGAMWTGPHVSMHCISGHCEFCILDLTWQAYRTAVSAFVGCC